MELRVVAAGSATPAELDGCLAKITRLARRAPVLDHGEVRLTDDPHAPSPNRVVGVVTLGGHGHRVRARAEAPTAATALDQVVAKLEHQIERLTGKLQERSQPRRRTHTTSG